MLHEFERVRALLARCQYRFATEAQLHKAIADLLEDERIGFIREYPLSATDRLDFWLPESGVAIEVKVRESMAVAMRQVERYLRDDRVRGLILAASRAWARQPAPPDPTLQGKPFDTVFLRRPI